jgi:hypothetical protein
MSGRPSRRRVGALVVTLIALGSLLSVPAAAVSNVAATSAGSLSHAGSVAPSAPSSVSPPTLSTPHHVPPPSPPPASGRGVFFNNTAIPTAPAAYSDCNYQPQYYSRTCMNNTGEPSLVATSTGALAVAYTALTNETACPGEENYTLSEIGVAVSMDGGATFGSPQYLDNPTCTQPSNFTSAIDPAITALANGTLVLAYLQYNISWVPYVFYPPPCNGVQYQYFPALGPCAATFDQLVLTESYDNGSTWTSPVVINGTASNPGLNLTGWSMPYEPSIAAYGNTVYLAWVNLTLPAFWYPNQSPYVPSTGVNLVTSTDGGATWSAPVQLPVEANALPTGGTAWVADSPSLLVNATGTLFVAYTTDFQAQTNLFCQPTGCSYLFPSATEAVVVASTSNAGASFTLSTLASEVILSERGGYTWGQGYYDSGAGNPLLSPQTSIAVDPTTGELYVAYSGGEIGTVCYLPGNCYTTNDFEDIWVANSTNGGMNWSSPLALGDALLGVDGAATDSEFLYNPSISVGSDGRVYVDAGFTNYSNYNIYYEDEWSDLLFVSTDHGASFGAPLPVPSETPYDESPLWTGFDTSMTTYHGSPIFAWTLEVCPGMGALGYCGSLSNNFSYSQVVVSSLYNETGITVSFTETGLPSAYDWSISLGGNVRAGPGGTPLSVSGVPVNETLEWLVPPVSPPAYGLLYISNISGGNTSFSPTFDTESVNFSEFVYLTISTIPSGATYAPFSCGQGSAYGDDCANAVISPTPGAEWVPVNSSLAYSEYAIGFPMSCYNCFNVSFQAWTGTGAGSWNTTVPNGTAVIRGPVNETASFAFLSTCQNSNGLLTCLNVTYPYFFHENGLPAGTLWGVTLGNASAFTTNSTEVLQNAFGPLNFTVWTVPGSNASWSWIGTPDESSPVTSVQGGNITITYRLLPNTQPFAVQWRATGLPASATGWGLDLGSSEYGIPLSGATLMVVGGAPGVTLNASTVYGNAGVGAYLTGFEVSPDAVGEAPYHVAVGGSIELDGPATIVAQFAPEFWLSVPIPANGTVNGTSEWLHSGTVVTIGAKADPGYYFVGWTGTGPGSKSTSAVNVTFTVNGPVTEVATFASVPIAYTLTVGASGVPVGQPVTIFLGGQGYTGIAPFAVPGLAPGSYPISAPTIAPNESIGTEYLVTGIASTTLPISTGMIDLNANGTVTVSYATDYLLTINPTVNGTVSPAPGAYWEAAGTPVTITATPANATYVFAGWNGTGEGSSNATSASIQVTLAGPVSETAVFAVYIPPPAVTYTLELTTTGLPASVAWSAWIGSYVVTGTGPLLFSGLNGSVTVSIGTVSPSAGTEYIPSAATVTLSVTANSNHTVAFSAEFEVSVSTTTGGTATPSSEWVANGSSVNLAAVANSGFQFVNWSGSGAGAYSGTNLDPQLTVRGPVSEVANFAPIPSSSSSSGSGSYTVPIVALVVLLIAGLVIGLVVARARRPRAPPPTGAPTPAAEATPAATGSAAASPAAPWSEGPAPSAGDEEEHIYGGGSG